MRYPWRMAVIVCALTALAETVVAAPAASGVAVAPASAVLTAKLSGSYLHASPTGSGTAKLTVTGSRVCWQFTFKGIDKPTVSGIHGTPPPPAGQRKTSIIPFVANFKASGCVQRNADRIKALLAGPSRFYVDIHSVKYPNGAIGGQLHKA